MPDFLPTHVFEDVSADLFQSGELHMLVYADQLFGWPIVHRWKWDPTAREVLHAVIDNFVELGVPMPFRSDNGPQFDAGVFRTAMDRWGSPSAILRRITVKVTATRKRPSRPSKNWSRKFPHPRT